MNNEIQKRESETNPSRRDDAQHPFAVIDRFFEDSWDPFLPFFQQSMGPGRLFKNVSRAFPKVDVEETDAEIVVTANIPGIDADNVAIEVDDDYLSLSGIIEKENKTESERGKVYRYEREFGEFRREFSLPARVDKDKIVAKAKNGVLTIHLPKSASEAKKRVKVEVE